MISNKYFYKPCCLSINLLRPGLGYGALKNAPYRHRVRVFVGGYARDAARARPAEGGPMDYFSYGVTTFGQIRDTVRYPYRDTR
ncbi:hypothetical protein [Heliothis virescens ascovirus 3e]|uniref:Uncharacterized protein n=1 Tax=Heliothis virescens ascovirus 3e TaxID=260797 RepID=A4KXC2_HVAVE|nr:hypothetical protein HVAV3e_gp066 [Heliothis virescens ascovirus 3e]ABO37253.1 hypothetical protein [Heliothis virescens ascovirus 3e]